MNLTSIKDVAEILTTIGIAFKTSYNENEINLYYDFLKDYDKKVLSIATKEMIKNCTFAPKISDMLKYCDEAKENQRFEVLDYMLEKGYFTIGYEEMVSDAERYNYEKANKWFREKNIPSWFQEDVRKYFQQMKQEQEQLQKTDVKFLE